MILAIDSGNTFVKIGVNQKNDRLAFFQTTYEELPQTLNLISENFKIENIVTSVVGHLDLTLFKSFFTSVDIVSINHQVKFPFLNLYETPQTLGIDRMVLSAGAVFNYPQQNRLVIDMGSCITYDFINEKDEYLGGAISPGVDMRYATLHEKTAKLPALLPESNSAIIGQNTNQAIHSGVMNGILFEIKGFVNHFLKGNDNFIIILTGGSAIFFAKPLKSLIFAEPNFLLNSLVQLFIYQKNND
jgi:type III pantothenate kinase